ncbi:MAG: hypothetical protein L7T24_00490, partial [Luminiphilus sp.]|nr:hypothetical protein [Luminiphilus sp.]
MKYHQALGRGALACWLLVFQLLLPVNAIGQEPTEASPEQEPTVGEQFDAFELRFYRIRQTEGELIDVGGTRLDALLYNLDEESLDVLKRFVVVANGILQLAESSPERGELAARLALRNDQLDEGFGTRFKKLERRIAQKYELLDTLSGADRAFLSAEIDGLNEQRLRYLERMIDVVRVRGVLNFPSGVLEDLANRSLLSYASERLGALQLLKAQRTALQAQLKLTPSDADVQ